MAKGGTETTELQNCHLAETIQTARLTRLCEAYERIGCPWLEAQASEVFCSPAKTNTRMATRTGSWRLKSMAF